MKAIILAAGKGTRLHSDEAEMPKALRPLAGRPLIHYVLDNLGFIKPKDTIIVVGYRGDQVRETVGPAYRYVRQPLPYNGTARATLATREALAGNVEPVLVAYCDMPFLRRQTYQMMFDAHNKTGAGNTLLAGVVDPPLPYGRLIRDAGGSLIDIVEESAATPAQRLITEINVGIQVLDGVRMWGWLEKVQNDNPKREYYLTSLAGVLAHEGVLQTVVQLENLDEMEGVNTLEELAAAEARIAQNKY